MEESIAEARKTINDDPDASSDISNAKQRSTGIGRIKVIADRLCSEQLYEEGRDNDDLFSHPSHKAGYAKSAFKIVHHRAYHVVQLVVCCFLLALAIIEDPSWIDIPAEIKPWIVRLHSAAEILLLIFVAASIMLRFTWMKLKTFKHRTTIVAIILVIMFFEALVVLVRSENHFRVTRCLRPVFFVDAFLMVGVRRVLRQICQLCLKQIFDVMLLLFLMVSVFAFAAYYLFADINPIYFDTFLKSFLSLFITLTTANHPDVFMEAYARKKAYALFFVLYVFVTVFFLTFKCADHEVMYMFKALQSTTQPKGFLCLKEFYGFYEMENLHWQQVNEDGEVYAWYNPKLEPIFKWFYHIERFKGLDCIMTAIVLMNAAYLMFFAIITSYYCGADEAGDAGTTSGRDELLQYCDNRFVASSRHSIIAGSFIFNIVYLIEIFIRAMAVGPYEYFRRKWNIYDSIVLLVGLLFLCLEYGFGHNHSVRLLVIFRPVKLLSMMLLFFVIFYFYAIIGMELFSGAVYPECCENALYGVGVYYSSTLTNHSSNLFWLNNFDNIYQSYGIVTLYEEMVVNNWFIQMEGFVSETTIYARFYFITFWMIMTICLYVSLTYIVDAFVYSSTLEDKQQCKQHGSFWLKCRCITCSNTCKKIVQIHLTQDEINRMNSEIKKASANDHGEGCCFINRSIRKLKRFRAVKDNKEEKFYLVGRRLRTKEDTYLEKYKDDLENWISDDEPNQLHNWLKQMYFRVPV